MGAFTGTSLILLRSRSWLNVLTFTIMLIQTGWSEQKRDSRDELGNEGNGGEDQRPSEEYIDVLQNLVAGQTHGHTEDGWRISDVQTDAGQRETRYTQKKIESDPDWVSFLISDVRVGFIIWNSPPQISSSPVIKSSWWALARKLMTPIIPPTKRTMALRGKRTMKVACRSVTERDVVIAGHSRTWNDESLQPSTVNPTQVTDKIIE